MPSSTINPDNHQQSESWANWWQCHLTRFLISIDSPGISSRILPWVIFTHKVNVIQGLIVEIGVVHKGRSEQPVGCIWDIKNETSVFNLKMSCMPLRHPYKYIHLCEDLRFWNLHLSLYRNKKKLRKTEKRKLKKHSTEKFPVITITHYFCLKNLVKDIFSDFPSCKFSIITKYIIINDVTTETFTFT